MPESTTDNHPDRGDHAAPKGVVWYQTRTSRRPINGVYRLLDGSSMCSATALLSILLQSELLRFRSRGLLVVVMGGLVAVCWSAGTGPHGVFQYPLAVFAGLVYRQFVVARFVQLPRVRREPLVTSSVELN